MKKKIFIGLFSLSLIYIGLILTHCQSQSTSSEKGQACCETFGTDYNKRRIDFFLPLLPTSWKTTSVLISDSVFCISYDSTLFKSHKGHFAKIVIVLCNNPVSETNCYFVSQDSILFISRKFLQINETCSPWSLTLCNTNHYLNIQDILRKKPDKCLKISFSDIYWQDNLPLLKERKPLPQSNPPINHTLKLTK